MSDNVRHPTHYNLADRKECWEEMREIFGNRCVIIFDVLNAYKYYYRRGSKDGNPKEQDEAKIEAYMNHAKELLKTYDTEIGKNAYDAMIEILDMEE